jgi:hypothetical protein
VGEGVVLDDVGAGVQTDFSHAVLEHSQPSST